MQQLHYQEKLTMVLNDFELQLEELYKMSVQFSVQNKYSYSFLAEQIYNESVLLTDFEHYRNFSMLTDDLFLYYHDHGDNSIYHTNGKKLNLDIHLGSLPLHEAETLKEVLSSNPTKTELLAFSPSLYILIPFNTIDIPSGQSAILGCEITYNKLHQRFKLVSGGLEGNLSFYMNESFLFSTQDVACTKDDKKVLTATTEDGKFTICYLPQERLLSTTSILLPSLFLLADMLLLLILAYIFANRAYKPLLDLKGKYGNKDALLSNKEFKNAFEEIDDIISQTMQDNILVNLQVQQKQDILKQQILRLLLNSTYSADIPSYLDKLDISLTGPFYYVICIAFSAEVDETFLTQLQRELEQIVTENNAERVYAVCNQTTRQVWTICNLADRENEAEMTEYVVGVAQSYSYEPDIGIGGIYTTLSRISASWLESIENLTYCKKTNSQSKNEDIFVYHSNDLQWMKNTLGTGNEKAALNALNEYVQHLRDSHLSLLMQQYVFAEFITEIGRLSKLNGVELSSQVISLLVSAKSIEEFHESASELLHEYCQKFTSLIQEKSVNENNRVFAYIKAHFTEYSLSIEAVAEALGMTNVAVREIVFRGTGRKYKDYLLDLRIEYAKQLLLEEDIPVADVCTSVGYVSVSYFISVFKECTGVTPAKYRLSNSRTS